MTFKLVPAIQYNTVGRLSSAYQRLQKDVFDLLENLEKEPKISMTLVGVALQRGMRRPNRFARLKIKFDKSLFIKDVAKEASLEQILLASEIFNSLGGDDVQRPKGFMR